jgi:protein-L-isoaspartate O-methyltransferase
MEYFTANEANKRDRIVIGCFGKYGINRIVNTISELLLERTKPKANAEVMDVGAGSGFFTSEIADKIHARLPEVAFYAMTMISAMLLSL